jgi:hypothetical protein
MCARYSGKTGVVYIGPTNGGAAITVVGLSKWSLDQSTDKQECTAFQDTNRQYVTGLPDTKGSVSGFWDNSSSETLFTAAVATGVGSVKVYLYPTSLLTTKYWYGDAFFDSSIETEVKDAIKVSGAFVAAGNWGRL